MLFSTIDALTSKEQVASGTSLEGSLPGMKVLLLVSVGMDIAMIAARVQHEYEMEHEHTSFNCLRQGVARLLILSVKNVVCR